MSSEQFCSLASSTKLNEYTCADTISEGVNFIQECSSASLPLVCITWVVSNDRFSALLNFDQVNEEFWSFTLFVMFRSIVS